MPKIEIAIQSDIPSWLDLVTVVADDFPGLDITFREDDLKGVAPRALYQRLGFEPEELLMEFDYPVQRFVLHRQ